VARDVESDDPQLAARLAAHRARFAMSLVGRWNTAQGSFDAMMVDEWEFRADGTATAAAGVGLRRRVRRAPERELPRTC
jgi:hypothetical protein